MSRRSPAAGRGRRDEERQDSRYRPVELAHQGLHFPPHPPSSRAKGRAVQYEYKTNAYKVELDSGGTTTAKATDLVKVVVAALVDLGIGEVESEMEDGDDGDDVADDVYLASRCDSETEEEMSVNEVESELEAANRKKAERDGKSWRVWWRQGGGVRLTRCIL